MSDNIATFVIPAYIESSIYLNFLDECIQGLINQTDSNWNAIIIDDCSPQKEIRDLLKKYSSDSRINSISLSERRSTGYCRNIGIEWAQKHHSEYILYNDADDISDCNRVKWVKKIFEENPNVDVIYSPVRIIDEMSNPVDHSNLSPGIVEVVNAFENDPPKGKDCWKDIGLRTGYVNVTSATSVRTNLAVKEKFPDEYVSEDSHTWYRYAANGEFYFSEKIHSMYRLPTFVKRQSSEKYVQDFNLNKIRVDLDGYSKAIDIAIKKENISEADRLMLEIRFIMRLIESMGKVNRLDLVYELAKECNKRIKKVY